MYLSITISQATSICTTAEWRYLERPHYFPRQLIAPDDLTQGLEYFRRKSRRHNRLLHGWGIVCGLRVRRLDDCKVEVEDGFALGPQEDDIVVPEAKEINLCQDTADCADITDPWCSDVQVDRQGKQTIYLAVRYAECHTRPVRVYGNGCGCDEAECEYSRIRDSYEIRALAELPDSYNGMPPPLSAGQMCHEPCLTCPTDPWVILADITLKEGEVVDIDCYSHRRYVYSYTGQYFRCRPVFDLPFPPPRALPSF